MPLRLIFPNKKHREIQQQRDRTSSRKDCGMVDGPEQTGMVDGRIRFTVLGLPQRAGMQTADASQRFGK